jgi:hypothetical protein
VRWFVGEPSRLAAPRIDDINVYIAADCGVKNDLLSVW